jgi:SAM-dependent methyltransferase
MRAMAIIANYISGFSYYRKLRVIDIGSKDINGCYRSLFSDQIYTGYDVDSGPNVDIIGGIEGLYNFPFRDNKFDVAISGQTIEHVEDIYAWVKEIARIVKPTGLIAIIGPNSFKEHRFPVDCWRILPDGMKFLLEKVAGLEVIRVWKKDRDTIGIGRKRRQCAYSKI